MCRCQPTSHALVLLPSSTTPRSLSCLLPETQTFVDRLFEAVNSKSYLPHQQDHQPASAAKTEVHLTRTNKDDQRKDEVTG